MNKMISAILLAVVVPALFLWNCGGKSGSTGVSKNILRFVNNTDRRAHITIKDTAHDFYLESGAKATKEVGESEGTDFFVDITLEGTHHPVSKSITVSVGQTVRLEGQGEVMEIFIE